jgi:uncharacterized membrane protein YqjE
MARRQAVCGSVKSNAVRAKGPSNGCARGATNRTHKEVKQLLKTLRRRAATVLAIQQNRLELLVVEVQEECFRLCNSLLLTATIVALGFFTLATAVSVLVAVVWYEFGVKGLWALSGLGLIGTLFTYGVAAAKLRGHKGGAAGVSTSPASRRSKG